jgi:hypothetical protein
MRASHHRHARAAADEHDFVDLVEASGQRQLDARVGTHASVRSHEGGKSPPRTRRA